MQKQVQFYLKSTKISNIDFFTDTIFEIIKTVGGSAFFITLPTQIFRVSVLSSPHVYKKFKDHYEVRTYKRLIKVILPINVFEILPLVLKKKPFELNCKITFMKL